MKSIEMNLKPSNGEGSNSYDVAVIGAGPSGCAAALLLRQANFRVCLIDQVNENLLKVGESIPPAVGRLLKRMGIGDLSRIANGKNFRPCLANLSAWGTDQWTYQDSIMDPEGHGWHINRSAFDKGLRTMSIREGVTAIRAKVKAIEVCDGFSEIKVNGILNNERPTSVLCKWVIDAAGRSSRINTWFGISKLKITHQMAAVTWLKEDGQGDQLTRVKSVANGWWYTAHLPNQMRVVVFHGLPRDVALLKKDGSEFIRRFNEAEIISKKLNSDKIINGIIACDAGTSKLMKYSRQGFIAAGDAAISFDPLAAQGIFFALYSGVKAAETIISCAKQADRSRRFLQEYSSRIEKVFQENQKRRRYFYLTETRFSGSEYWTAQQKMY